MSSTSTATAAYIHGPADPGSTAAIVLALPPRNMFPIVSPLRGSATLSQAQAADLMAGKWYVDVTDPTNVDFTVPFKLRVSFKAEPDASLTTLPKLPASHTPLERALFSTVERAPPARWRSPVPPSRPWRSVRVWG